MSVSPTDLIRMGIEKKHPHLEGKVEVDHDPRYGKKNQHVYRARRQAAGIKLSFRLPLSHDDFSHYVQRAADSCAELLGNSTCDEIRRRVA